MKRNITIVFILAMAIAVVTGVVLLGDSLLLTDSNQDDHSSAHLSCVKQGNVSGPEPIEYQELSTDKQALVESAVDGDLPNLNRSEAKFFENNWVIVYGNESYICEPAYP